MKKFGPAVFPAVALAASVTVHFLTAQQVGASSIAGQEASPYTLVEKEQHLMGTLFTVKVYANTQDQGGQAIELAFDRARKWQGILSAHDAQSELSALNDAPDGTAFEASDELANALSQAWRYAHVSQGTFDPTFGPCIRLWKRAFSRRELPSLEALSAARDSSGYAKLVIDGNRITKTVPGMRIDLGGIGKGFAADRMADVLRGKGITIFCISTTSDVLAGDPPPGRHAWKVARPAQGGQSETVIQELANAAVSTSGDDHQSITIKGTTYSHIVNPETGMGLTDGPKSVTIQAKTATEADALATICRVLTPANALTILEQFPGSRMVDEAAAIQIPKD